MNNNSGIYCNNLTFSYEKRPGENDYVFKDFSLHVNKGEFVTLIGPSGCGKTTLLSIISGLLMGYTGSVFKDGELINAPNKDLGMVFQDYSLFPWLTVRKNVEVGMRINKVPEAIIRSRTEIILNRVGLWDARKKYPFQLSGGMKQRTAIARVLANDSNYLLMDEPFGALDYQTRLKMQVFLSELSREYNKTVIFVTHHVEEAIILSNRVVLMTSNRKGNPDEIFIEIPHPREISGLKFNDYRRYIINHLDNEINKQAISFKTKREIKSQSILN